MKFILERNAYWYYRLNKRFFEMLFSKNKVDILLTWNNDITAPWSILSIKNKINIIEERMIYMLDIIKDYERNKKIKEDYELTQYEYEYYDSNLEHIDIEDIEDLISIIKDLKNGKYDKKAYLETIKEQNVSDETIKEFEEYIRNISVKKFKI